MCKGLSGNSVFKFAMAGDQAKDQARVNAARTRQRDARNERNAANSTLARFTQSLSNQKLMNQAGKNQNIIAENLGRSLDAMAYGDTMTNLALSEQIGSLTAAAAAAGMGGTSVDNYNRTMKTAHALRGELTDRSNRSQVRSLSEARGDVLTSAVDSMGRDSFIADMDFSYLGPTKGPSVLGNLATLAVAVGVSAAGAPQLGDAILKARTAGMQNAYGDPKGAAQSFDGALESFKGGVGEARDKFRFNSSNSPSALVQTGANAAASFVTNTQQNMMGNYGTASYFQTMGGPKYTSPGITFR